MKFVLKQIKIFIYLDWLQLIYLLVKIIYMKQKSIIMIKMLILKKYIDLLKHLIQKKL